MSFWRFETDDPSLGPVLEGAYDPILVTLSIVIACFAGITALILADRMIASRSSPTKSLWHAGGAVAMGCGIWAMHFTGMLAFRIPNQPHMTYDLGLTFLSLIPAVVGSGAALHFIAQPRPGRQLHWCAVLMAGGIGTMHYTGMEAMRMDGLRYDFYLFGLSVLVAHLLALVALSVRFGIRRLPSVPEHGMSIIAGTVMGVAVAGMHYTAMSASNFHQTPAAEMEGALLSGTAMATAIGGFAGVLLVLSMVATWIDRQIEFRRNLELEQIAHNDGLTGLPNRIPFVQRLQLALTEGCSQDNRVAVLFLDLNDFKTINDSLGHAVGDRVLQECAARLRRSIRTEDTVARFGGDEFVVLIGDLIVAEDAETGAERLLQSLEAPMQFGGRRLHLSASIGISFYPDDGETADELVQKADTAMYEAKHYRLRYYFFDRVLTDEAMKRVRLGNDLRDALEQNQLVFEYQPWIDLDSGRWLGLEALARWTHPEEGDVSPAVFIPLAERSGLILQFEEWALRNVCLQGRSWLDAGFEFDRIAVNVSAPQFAREDFVRQLQGILEETDFPGNRLELEITESSLMDNDPRVIRRMHRIRGIGVTLAVDDFGTGYSSLSYLKELPVNKLKIDRTFARGIPNDPKDSAIIRSVAHMSASLGFTVVTEGIEREEQREGLVRLGCHVGQGFLFSRPLTVAAVETAFAYSESPVDFDCA